MTSLLDGLDLVVVEGIRGFGFHGVLEHERQDGQPFVVDVVLGLDTRAAAASDDLTDTVDYAGVALEALAHLEGPPCALIETLAERVAQSCLRRELVRAVRVTVHKPQAPVPVPFGDVFVTVERTR